MPHLVCFNGGPLVIPLCSPLNAENDGKSMLRQIYGAVRIKNLRAVCTIVHAPCGAGGDANLNMLESLLLHALVPAAMRDFGKKRDLPMLDVIPLFNVEYPGADGEFFRTYRFEHELFQTFMTTPKARQLEELYGRAVAV